MPEVLVKWMLLIPICLLSLACTSPAVIPTRSDASFKLTQIKGSRFALWPVLTADLDTSISETVAKEYPSQDKFLDALTDRLVDGFTTRVQADYVKPAEVVGAFKDKSLRDLLDPTSFLNSASTESRFGLPNDSMAGFIQKLNSQPLLKDVRYLIIPAQVAIGRKVSYNSGGVGMYSGGPNGGLFMGGGSSSANSSARLRVAVVDLPQGKIVWDGSIAAVASSSIMKATALHEVEADLVAHLLNALDGIEDVVPNEQ